MPTMTDYITKIGSIMSTIFCIDRVGRTGNVIVDTMINEFRDVLARILADLVMNQLDAIYDGKSPDKNMDTAISNLHDTVINMMNMAIAIGGDKAKKYDRCLTYLKTVVTSQT